MFANVANDGEDTPPIPDIIPERLGEAADILLRVVRGNMSRQSFRVVPAKVRRFVAFVGQDATARQIDGPT